MKTIKEKLRPYVLIDDDVEVVTLTSAERIGNEYAEEYAKACLLHYWDQPDDIVLQEDAEKAVRRFKESLKK